MNTTLVSQIMTKNPVFVNVDSSAVDALLKMVQGELLVHVNQKRAAQASRPPHLPQKEPSELLQLCYSLVIQHTLCSAWCFSL